jgi:hypothetical protein
VNLPVGQRFDVELPNGNYVASGSRSSAIPPSPCVVITWADSNPEPEESSHLLPEIQVAESRSQTASIPA